MSEKRILDDFEDLSGWKPHHSGRSELFISSDQGRTGRAMRLDFDFHGGGGFVVARREIPLEIPESYSFLFHIRGTGPSNIFEFKLVDDSDRNVWRYRVEAFDLPKEWLPVRIRDSEIEFAWGPVGGGVPRKVAAIELVMAAGPGGKGTVWFDELAFQDDTYRSVPLVRSSSALTGHEPENLMDPSDPSSWRSDPSDPQWVLIDFQEEREFGGLVIHWEKGLSGRRFEVHLATEEEEWRPAYSTAQGGGERSHLYLPRARARQVRLDLYESVQGRGFGIRAIEVKPFHFSRSVNQFFQNIALEYPSGRYPKYFSGRQTYWTTVGSSEGDGQGLFNEEGMVEVDKGTFSVAPFLFAAGRLISWADATIVQDLMKGHLPIPSSEWRFEDLRMKVTAFADRQEGRSVLNIRYRLESLARGKQDVTLFAAILPFQVTPTWQNWRRYGGVSSIRELSYGDGVLRVNGEKSVIPLSPVAGFGAAPFAEGSVVNYLEKGRLPARSELSDEFGYGSGAIRFDLELEPGSAKEVVLAAPFGFSSKAGDDLLEAVFSGGSATERLERTVKGWESVLEKVVLHLPATAHSVADTFRTAAAHILINRDGPAIHPGPRRYDRSWIRDGAMMGAALARVGLPEPLRDFIRWYGKYQAPDGNIPDCVDREGTEWLPEFDAYGQFVFGVVEYYRFTKDRAFLEEMRPAVTRALAYMEGLRAKRLTREYESPDKRACYGLLPESMSHEGYMAHPVHAYWDDFWGVRGLQDAAVMAEVLGDRAEAERFSVSRAAFSRDIRESLSAAIARHKIDFVPGSVEFGDFDPTATSVAINLLGQLDLLPRARTEKTFDRYMVGFREREAGKVDWNNYSAYEIRIIGALVRLGRRDEAMDLIRFMLAGRRIPCWNQWPEITWRDPLGPSFIGDLPHTWISGEFIVSVRTMFAYEREGDDSLVIGAGLPGHWFEGGFEVGAENLPTYHGNISYRMQLDGTDRLRASISGDLLVPPGGIVVLPPLPRPIRQVDVNGKRIDGHTAEGFTCRACPAEAVVTF
jgi:hypothetical protein